MRVDTPSTPIQELAADHRTIEKALEALRQEVEAGRATGAVQASLIRDLCSFSQSFVDRCHHGKEEGCLFPCLEKRGLPRDAGPIAVMLEEHERGRRLVGRISESLDSSEANPAGVTSVIELCQEYYELLTQHIAKEEGILFPLGASVMEGNDDSETAQCFELKKDEVGREEIDRQAARAADLFDQRERG